MSNRDSPARVLLNPHEEALQSLCKQILKSRLFRGYYQERRYVEPVHGYRDIIALQRGEKELDKLLRDIREKLQLFYQQTQANMWIGITSGNLANLSLNPGAMETYIWVELNELAFGQYWFSIKSIRFREQEIILKLKMVRPVENEEPQMAIRRTRLSSASSQAPTKISESAIENTIAESEVKPPEPEIGFKDFVGILNQWGTSTKRTIYDFLSNISQQNLIEFVKFVGLLIVSIIAGAISFVKFLGVFVIRFMFELSRLTHVLTPIILKVVDLFNKIIGGFYILLAMLWKDAVVNRGRPQPVPNAVEYNRPLYKSIEYNVRQQQFQGNGRTSHYSEFERNFQ